MKSAHISPGSRSPEEAAGSAPSADAVSASPERRFSYQPALDGLRALAVIAVVVFHQQFSWARGGFLGVDIFFVLSGYLITSLLLEEWLTTGRVDVLAFWARRARRLLPALYLVIFGIAVYVVVWAVPQDLGKLRADSIATLAGVTNWRALRAPNITDLTPLRHTWSLGVEQQWYVVWPLLLLLCLRLRGGSLKWLLGATLLLAVASAGLMALLYNQGSGYVRIFNGTDTRAQSLLVGGALAILFLLFGSIRNERGKFALEIAGAACAVAILCACIWMPPHNAFLYQGGYLLFAIGVAVVIATVVQPNVGLMGRLFELSPLRRLGQISYGVYLWHLPVFWVLTDRRTFLNGWVLFGTRVYLTLMLSIISYNLVETPFRRGAFRNWRASWAIAPVGALSLAGLIFLVTSIK